MQMAEMLADWNISKTLCLIAAASAANVLQAKTVAWYRFEENGPGVVATSETRFTNSVDAAKFPAYAGVCNFGGQNRYAKNSLAYDADKMPYATNAFPSTISLVNSQDLSRETANGGALALNMHSIESADSPHAQLFIDDDADLRLQTFTLEFFVRIPDNATPNRYLVTRCGSMYTSTNSAFSLYLKKYTNDAMYLNLKVGYTDESSGELASKDVSLGFSGCVLDNDRWHHVALVADGATHTMTAYIDYVLRGTATYTGDLNYEEGYPLAFGGHPQSTYSNSAIIIDEVRISDDVLAVSQMLKYKAAVSAAAAVDDNTLFYFPFEGSSEPVTVGESDMQTPATYVPCYRNMAVNSSFSATDAAVFEKSTATNPAVPVRDGDVPVESVRLGLRGRTEFADTAALHSLTNSADTDYMSPLIVDTGSMQTDLFSDSCTVEFFFKLPASGYCASSDGTKNNIKLIGLVNAFYIMVYQTAGTWQNGQICARIGNTDLNSDWASHPTYSKATYNDGIWHRCALVYDKDDSRAELYIDGKVVMSKDSVPAPSLARHASYSNGLLIGGDWYTDRWAGDMHIDEVRISRGALRPHQFLTATAFEEDLLARASFDGDLVMTPYTNFFGEAGTASAFTSGGSAPGYSRDVPAKALKKGRDGDVVVERNSRSLEFQGGKVVWPGRALVADADEFTVEFFIKSSSAVPGAGIMRVNRGSEADVTSAVTWAISFADASGSLRMQVDTDEAAGQTHDFAAALADDAWHHVGIQFAADGADTLVSVYRDKSLVGTWSATGRLLTNPREMNLMLGAGEDQSAGFSGCIDELRIAPGIVDPSSFMTPISNGMTIIVR